MTKNLFCSMVAALIFSIASGQDFETYLKENAARIDKLDSLNDRVYELMANYQLIMIGEMHGTNEPAQFVTGLAELFTSKGDSVLVGFEIPPGQMTKFQNEHSEKSIYSSDFFSKSSVDGRASVAWAAAISRLNKNPRTKIFFFDVNDGECKNTDIRDSVMYIKIKNKIQEHPNWKTITLSGNVHNMLLSYRGKNKTAFYLNANNELNITDKICSLNHLYQSGTMNNNQGDGLKTKDVGNIETKYSTGSDLQNYLFLFPLNYKDSYNGIFFTRKITAAKMVTE